MNTKKVDDVLRACTASIVCGTELGTGFFVAPQLILTCGHVIKKHAAHPISVTFQNSSHPATLDTPSPYLDNPKGADLSLLRVNTISSDHPVCLLEDGFPDFEEDLHTFGYTKGFPEGEPETFVISGVNYDPHDGYLLKFHMGKAYPGMSGAPLVSLSTGRVCGIMAISYPDTRIGGGRALAVSTAYSLWPKVREAQSNATNHAWSTALGGRPRDHVFTNYLNAVESYASAGTYRVLPNEEQLFYAPLSFTVDTRRVRTIVPQSRDSRLSLQDVMDMFQTAVGGACVIVEGQAGAGKSTLLRRLAEKAWRDPTEVGLNHPYIPLPIRLRHLVPTSGSVDSRLRAALTNDKTFNISEEALPTNFYSEWPLSKNAKWLLLFDGLDEIQAEAGEIVTTELKYLVNFLIRDGHSVIISSRPKSVDRGFSETFPTFSIAPLDEKQEFVLSSHYLGSATQDFLNQYRELKVGSGARTPLLVAIAVSIYRKRKHDRLPLRIIDLFAEFVAECLDEAKSRGLKDDSDKHPLAVLQKIALATTQDPIVLSEDKLVDAVGSGSSLDFRSFLRRLGQHSGLLHHAGASYDWLHATFREFLAARQIADIVSTDEPTAWGYVRLWEKNNWHQIVFFLLQILSPNKPSIVGLAERLANLDKKGLFFAASLIPEGVDLGQNLERTVFVRLIALTQALNRMVYPNYLLGVEVLGLSPFPCIGSLRSNEFVARETVKLVRERGLQPWLRIELIKVIAGPAAAADLVAIVEDQSEQIDPRLVGASALIESGLYSRIRHTLEPLLVEATSNKSKRDIFNGQTQDSVLDESTTTIASALAKHESSDLAIAYLAQLAGTRDREAAVRALRDLRRRDELTALATASTVNEKTRALALGSLLSFEEPKNIAPLCLMLITSDAPIGLRERAIDLLARCDDALGTGLLKVGLDRANPASLRIRALNAASRLPHANNSLGQIVVDLSSNQDEDAETRVGAAKLSIQLGRGSEVSQVLRAIAGNSKMSVDERRNAAVALDLCGNHEQARGELANLAHAITLTSDERRFCAVALAEMGEIAEAEAALRVLCKDTKTSPGERYRAAISLGELGLEQARTAAAIFYEMLISHSSLSTESYSVNQISSREIGRLGSTGQIVKLVKNISLSHTQQELLFESLVEYGRTEPALEILTLPSCPPSIVWHCLDTLGALPPTEASRAAVVIVAQSAQSPGVRRKAIRTITRVHSSASALGILRELLQNPRQPVQARLLAADELVDLREKQPTFDTVREMAFDNDAAGWSRLWACRILRMLGLTDDAKAVLVHLRRDGGNPGEPPKDDDGELDRMHYITKKDYDDMPVRVQASLELAMLGDQSTAARDLERFGRDSSQSAEQRSTSGLELLRLGERNRASLVFWSIAEDARGGREAGEAFKILVAINGSEEVNMQVRKWLEGPNALAARKEAGLIYLSSQNDTAALEQIIHDHEQNASLRLSALIHLVERGHIGAGDDPADALLRSDDLPNQVVNQWAEALTEKKAFRELASFGIRSDIPPNVRLVAAAALVRGGCLAWAEAALRNLLSVRGSDEFVSELLKNLRQCKGTHAIAELRHVGEINSQAVRQSVEETRKTLLRIEADRCPLFQCRRAAENTHGADVWMRSLNGDPGALCVTRLFDHWLGSDLDDAEKSLAEVLLQFPGDSLFLVVRAFIGIDHGNYSSSLEDLDLPTSVLPRFLILSGMAEAFRRLGQPENAFAKATEAVNCIEPQAGSTGSPRDSSLNPVHAWAYFQRGMANRALGSPSKEILYDLGCAIALSPEFASALSERALLLLSGREDEAALADLNLALELDPQNPDYLSQRGRAHLLLSHYEAALQDFGAALWRNNSNSYFRGLAHYRLQHYPDATKDLSSYLTLEPDAVDALLLRANCYRKMGRHDEAVNDYSRVLELDSSNWQALTYRADSYAQTNRFEDAFQDFDRAIGGSPQHEITLRLRGSLHRKLGQHEDAISDLTEALHADPESVPAMIGRGLSYYELRRFDDALKDFSAALILDPDQPSVLWQRARTYRELRRYSDAITDIESRLKRSPADIHALFQRAEINRLMGRKVDALNDLNSALLIAPDEPELLLERSTTYRLMGQFDNALRDADRAVRLNPSNAIALARRGEAYRVMNLYEKAIDDLSHAISLDGTYQLAIYRRAVTYKSAGRFTEALRDIDVALRLDPNDIDSIEEKARIHDLLGETELAISELTEAIVRFPDSAILYSTRGNLYRDRSRYDEARSDYEHALELKQDYPLAVGARGWVYLFTQKWSEADRDFTTAAASTDDTWWRYSRFLALTLLGRTEEGKKELHEAITGAEDRFNKNRADRGNSLNRGLYYLASGDIRMAETAYAEALEITDYGLVHGAKRELLELLKLLPQIDLPPSILKMLSLN